MSVETVKVYTTDQDGNPLAGVLVRVFDLTGATFITQQISSLVDGLAVADFSLDGDATPISYTIRMSKTGVAFDGSLGDISKSPQMIAIYSPPGTNPNNFDVRGETFIRPAATDPRLCRCSGFFRDISGRPLVGLTITIINEFSPTVMDGCGVMGTQVEIQTNDDGYVEVDLYKNGKYIAWVPSTAVTDDPEQQHAMAFPRYMTVPNSSSANLPDLLFPIVDSIDFGVDSVSIGLLESVDLFPVVMATDGRTLIGAAVGDVIYSVSDAAVVGISSGALKVTLVGITPGTATLTAVRADQSIVKIPNTPISGQPITITVHA